MSVIEAQFQLWIQSLKEAQQLYNENPATIDQETVIDKVYKVDLSIKKLFEILDNAEFQLKQEITELKTTDTINRLYKSKSIAALHRRDSTIFEEEEILSSYSDDVISLVNSEGSPKVSPFQSQDRGDRKTFYGVGTKLFSKLKFSTKLQQGAELS